MSKSIFRARRGRRRRAVRIFAWTLIGVGVLALADAGLTMVWQEPITAVYASLRQHSLSGQLRAVEAQQPPAREQIELQRVHDEQRRVRMLAARMEGRTKLGSAVGRIQIPSIGSNFVLVDGTGTSELEDGPGIYTKSAYPTTSFPGAGGVTAIAGHRTTFLEPFKHIGELRGGEHILITMPYGKFTYEIVGKRSVQPTDISAVVAPTNGAELVLSSCTPEFSAVERLLVFARLTGVEPLGAAVIAPDKARVSALGWPGKGHSALLGD